MRELDHCREKCREANAISKREEVYHNEVWSEEVSQSTVNNWVLFLIECSYGRKQWMLQMQLAKGSEIYQLCGDGQVF